MKTKMFAAAILVAATAMTGCRTYPGIIQDKTKPIEQGRYTVVLDEVSATEKMVTLFGFSLSDLRGSAGRRMYKKALDQAPGADALIEYTVDTKTLDLVWLNIQWYTLTGTAVKTAK